MNPIINRPRERTRILVTNHDPVFLALIRELLEEAGYEALASAEPHEPYEFAKETQPDLVILDVVYREEGRSLTALDKLTLDPETAHIPVIVCSTAAGTLQSLERRRKDVGIRVLEKPFDLDSLLEMVRVSLAPRAHTARAGAPAAPQRADRAAPSLASVPIPTSEAGPRGPLVPGEVGRQGRSVLDPGRDGRVAPETANGLGRQLWSPEDQET
jgi:CheY-like chemotaxis protein